MREMKDSGVEWIGSVPTSWNIMTVGSLLKVRNEIVNDTDYPPLSVTKDGIVPQMKNVAKSDATDNRKMVLANDFVINSRSDRKQSCGVSPFDGSVSLINIVLYPTERAPVVPAYLNYLMKNNSFAEEFYRHGHGIVADLWTTRWQEMKSILLPVPTMEEQQRILETVSTRTKKVDALITNQQTQIEKLKAYKQSLITEVVTKGLDPDVPMKDSGVEWIGMIPEHWEIQKLKTRTNMLTPMRDKPADLSGPIPWIRIEDYSGKYISSSKEHLGVSADTVKAMNLKIYPIGTVLCTSSCDLGKCAIVEKELVSNQRFIGIIPTYRLSSEFLYYLMLSNAERLNTLSTGSIQANLSRVEFEQLLVQFPPLNEQLEITQHLDKKCTMVDYLIDITQTKIKKLEQYKKSLIYEYVTGKKEI
mgnify:CR=1 FL=1